MVDFHERDPRGGHRSLRGADDAPERDAEDGDSRDDEAADPGGGGTADDGSGDRTDADGHRDGDHRRTHDGSHDAHHDHHDHHADDLETVRAAVVTVSSTRSLDDDPSGDAVAEAFEAAGHDISTRELVVDDLDGVQGRLASLVRRDDVDAVVTTGGTGVTPDDVTVEAIRPLFEKTLPGFGELFRRRSEADIGTRVVATRAVAGIADGVPVFCLPGSEAAARLGAAEIVVPEVAHLAGLARRRDDG